MYSLLTTTPWIRMTPDLEATVKYLGAQNVVTHFNGKKIDSVEYTFEVDGQEMIWHRTSRELAKQMLDFSEGDLLTIRRTGQKNQTKYNIEKTK